MSIEGQRIYPGEAATPEQMLALADSYRQSADALFGVHGRRGQLHWSPYRLLAIQAIELYLSAYLLAAGCPAVKLRSFRHDLALRAKHAGTTTLRLRKRTLAHLQRLDEAREYLVIRYDPSASALSELNRIDATLREVATKVTIIVRPPDSSG